jgi:hypothetical protein
MHMHIVEQSPSNGTRPGTGRCHGRCGKLVEVPKSPEYQHKILLCGACWKALRSTLLHLVKVVKEVS